MPLGLLPWFMGREAAAQENGAGALDARYPSLPERPVDAYGYRLLDLALRGRLCSVGQFGWTGAATTWYTIDPREHLVAILLMQHLPRAMACVRRTIRSANSIARSSS